MYFIHAYVLTFILSRIRLYTHLAKCYLTLSWCSVDYIETAVDNHLARYYALP